MSPARIELDSSRGMILLVVLWIVAMMSVVVVALSAYAQKNLSLARLEADRLRTEMTLHAGVDVGVAFVLSINAEDRVLLDGSPSTVNIGDGRIVEVAVMDAAGLVDINRANFELINSLGFRLGLSKESIAATTEAIARLRTVSKTEDGTDNSRERKSPPAVFVNARQLYGVPGIDRSVVDRLLPYLSLYSIDGKINPMAAPETILQSIPALKPEDLEVLAAAKQRRQWKAPEVQDVLARNDQFLALKAARIFVVSVKTTAGPGLITGSRLQAVIAVNEAGRVPFRTLAWSW